ncbi:MAG: hypothetical protein IJW40_10575 [Clostridia bacterium]|nr:hypothetical protein [Clostridia bacterium]
MKIECFNYYTTGRMRFIGVDTKADEEAFVVLDNAETMQTLVNRLEPLKAQLEQLQTEYGTDIRELCYVNHSSNLELCNDDRLMVGYFFKADTPVPEGASYIDILTDTVGYGIYVTQNLKDDEDKAYVTTRDRILHDGNIVPYPVGYWTAMVFTNGLPHEGNYRFGYVFPSLEKPLYDALVEEYHQITSNRCMK